METRVQTPSQFFQLTQTLDIPCSSDRKYVASNGTGRRSGMAWSDGIKGFRLRNVVEFRFNV